MDTEGFYHYHKIKENYELVEMEHIDYNKFYVLDDEKYMINEKFQVTHYTKDNHYYKIWERKKRYKIIYDILDKYKLFPCYLHELEDVTLKNGCLHEFRVWYFEKIKKKMIERQWVSKYGRRTDPCYWLISPSHAPKNLSYCERVDEIEKVLAPYKVLRKDFKNSCYFKYSRSFLCDVDHFFDVRADSLFYDYETLFKKSNCYKPVHKLGLCEGHYKALDKVFYDDIKSVIIKYLS